MVSPVDNWWINKDHSLDSLHDRADCSRLKLKTIFRWPYFWITCSRPNQGLRMGQDQLHDPTEGGVHGDIRMVLIFNRWFTGRSTGTLHWFIDWSMIITAWVPFCYAPESKIGPIFKLTLGLVFDLIFGVFCSQQSLRKCLQNPPPWFLKFFGKKCFFRLP